MTPPVAITLTVKVHPPVGATVEDIDRLAEQVREDVERALTGAVDVELDDWTGGGGESW